MLIYHSQWQPIEDWDVILISKSYYLTVYDMRICTFILYPLSWHQIEKQHLGILNDVDWEWIWNINDILDKDIKIDSPFAKYIDQMQGWFELYMSQIKTNLSI